MSHVELCRTSYILFFLKNVFPPVTGLFLQFIIQRSLSQGNIYSNWLLAEEESYTTGKNRSGEEEEYSGFSLKNEQLLSLFKCSLSVRTVFYVSLAF